MEPKRRGRPEGGKNKVSLADVMKRLELIQEQLERIEGPRMDDFKVGGCD